MAARSIPSGEVTFLFTDIEGSTANWDAHHDAMDRAQLDHDAIVRDHIDRFAGHVFATGGDGVAVAFERPSDAVNAAIGIQRAIGRHAWPEPLRVRVRMGLNTGAAIERGGDYFGPAVIKSARLMSMVGGGRICVASSTVAAVALDAVDATFVPVGIVQLKGLGRPEPAWVVKAEGLDEPGTPLDRPSLAVGPPPVPTAPLVGRTTEVAHVGRLLGSQRLVTLVGIGGIGKTRLAQTIAAEVGERFADGVAWVELAEAVDATSLIHQVAHAIGATPQPGVDLGTIVAAALTGRNVLVVLDNCEHIAADVSPLVEQLLRHGASATFLATSRERLGVPGEKVVALGPLDTADPDAGISMLRELLDETDVGDDAVLTEIVTAVGGIPLAIELAAARCRLLGIDEVAERLSSSSWTLADPRRTVERHRALDGVLGWSVEAASPSAQRALRRLCVFAGSFPLVTAIGTAADADDDSLGPVALEDAIAELVDRSLVVRQGRRFRLLEPVKQFVHARCDEAELETSRRRHLAAMCARVARVHDGLIGSDEATWVAELDADWADVRAAVQRALDVDDADSATSLAVGLASEAFLRRPESFAWIDRIERRFGHVEGSKRAALLGAASLVAWSSLDLERAVELGERALELDDRPGSSVDQLPEAGALGAYNFSGRPDRAVEVCVAALESAASEMSSHDRSRLLSSLAMSQLIAGDPEASETASRAIESGERSGNPSALAIALYVKALVVSSAGGDPLEYALPLDRSVTLATSVRNQWLLGMCRSLQRPSGVEVGSAASLAAAIDVADDLFRSGWPTHGWTFGWSLPDLAWEAGLPTVSAAWLGGCVASTVPRLSQDELAPALAALLAGSSDDPELIDAFEQGRHASFGELRRSTLDAL